jgi:hypothetical protein
MKFQCLYYALDQWNESGGYIVFRKSTHWCMPHVLHYNNKTQQLTHYVPPEDLKYPWYSMFGFDGYIKTEDLEECVPVPPACMLAGSLALIIFGGIWYVSRMATRRNKRKAERRGALRGDQIDRRHHVVPQK